MSNTYISKIKLADNSVVYIKDAEARELIAGLSSATHFLGVTSTALSDGSEVSTIVVGGESVSAASGDIVIYNNKEFIYNGSSWAEFGDLNGIDDLAYHSISDIQITVTPTTDVVLGEGTTFTNASSSVTFADGAGSDFLTGASASAADSAVSFASHTTDSVLGADATFKTTGALGTVKLKATAANAALSTSDDTFVKSYPGVSSKMVQGSVTGVASKSDISIPNVTSVGSASTWAFAVGSGDDAETLVITGANGSAPVLGTALSASSITTESKTFATGALDSDGAGASVMTGLGTAVTADALTAASVSAQPDITISTDANGDVEVVSGLGTLGVSANDKDSVTAITALGAATAAAQTITVTPTKAKALTASDTGTAAAQTITVGTNDKVTALTGATAAASYAVSAGE